MVAPVANKERVMSEERVSIDEPVQVGGEQGSAIGWVAGGVIVGVLAAMAVLPLWLPGLNAATTGVQPKVFWYISRSSAFVAFVLLWASMAFGLGISNRLGRVWPGAPASFELHQLTGLLGLGFALVHALALLGDHYIGYSLDQVLVPFASSAYRPLWVGFGQIALYGTILVGLTFYVRKYIGQRAWRVIHFLSYAVFALALLHGITSGTDSGEPWAVWIYWISAGTLLFLTIYRVLAARYMTSAAAPRR